MRVNGGDWARWNNIEPSTTLTWDQVHDDLSGSVGILYDLPIGTNELEIAAREEGTSIDKVFITMNGITPTGVGGNSSNCASPEEPIILDAIADQTNTEGDTVSLQVQASGGDDTLTYAATGLPTGLSINPTSGEISGVVDNQAADNSPYFVEITVDDSDSVTTDVQTTSFNWTIHPAPIPISLNTIQDQVHTEADTVSLNVLASGGNGALTFTATGLPGGLSIDPVTGVISGIIDSTASNGSPYLVTITVDDSDVDTTDMATTSFTWTVQTLPIPIVLNPLADQTNTAADVVNLQISATGGNGSLTYSATGLPAGLNIHPSTGLISGTIDSTAANGSPYNVTITVDDADSDTTDRASESFVWNVDPLPIPIVLDPIADQLNTEGDAVALQVNASGGDQVLVYSATGLPPGLSINASSGLISGTVANTAYTGNPYPVIVTVDDSDGDTTDHATANFTWNIEDSPIAILLDSIADQNNNEGDTVSLAVIASGGNGNLNYSATGLPDGLSIDPLTGEISGVIDGAASGASPYMVTITVDDADSDTTDIVSSSFTWIIVPAPVEIIIEFIPDQVNFELDTVSLQVFASGGNNSLGYSATGLPGGLQIHPDLGTITGVIDSGASVGSPYTVTIIVDDSDADLGDVAEREFLWYVQPLPLPILVDPVPDQENLDGDLVSPASNSQWRRWTIGV